MSYNVAQSSYEVYDAFVQICTSWLGNDYSGSWPTLPVRKMDDSGRFARLDLYGCPRLPSITLGICPALPTTDSNAQSRLEAAPTLLLAWS